MKQYLSVFLLAFALFVGVATHAFADEFGDRFYNQAPAGLGDYTAESEEIPAIAMDEVAKDLQNVMPAAGEETEASTPQNSASE